MMNKEDYNRLNHLQKYDTETYNMIKRIQDSYMSELSIASHNIKNYISFIRSSYQIITEHHPEANDFIFWPEMKEAINDLNQFMDETSLYRYCSKAELTNTNLNNLLFELPDEMDSLFENEDRNYSFDVDGSELNINADYTKLKAALIEVLKNSFEATHTGDTINIAAHKNDSNKHVYLVISNVGCLETDEMDSLESLSNSSCDTVLTDSENTESTQEQTKKNSIDTFQLCEPFYSTKAEHSGLGLSIVHKVCMTHNADLDIKQEGLETQICITFPAAS